MESLATWVVLTFAVVSVTRFLLTDEFPPIANLREGIIEWFAVIDPHTGDLVSGRRWGKLGYSIAYLWTCYWCMSVWVGFAVLGICWLAGVYVWMGWLFPVVARLATGAWAMVENRHEASMREANQRIRRGGG